MYQYRKISSHCDIPKTMKYHRGKVIIHDIMTLVKIFNGMVPGIYVKILNVFKAF